MNNEEQDDVATLVRLAGRRGAVPAARAERVRATARNAWRREVAHRSRRRLLWAGAGLAAAAAVVLALALRIVPSGGSTPAGGDVTVVVEALVGSAWSGRASGAVRPLAVGVSVTAGSALRTDPDSLTAVRLPSGHSLRLDVSTEVRLLADGAVALDRGAIYLESGLALGARAIEIRTPLGTIEEIGTQFEARLDAGALRVRLREGGVAVHRDGRTQKALAGTELTVRGDGSIDRRPIASHGPAWDWVARVSPRFDLEGRTARTFLDSVARERGLTLAFADEEVARLAGEIVLAGAGVDLTHDDALDAVLPTCRMTYRIEGGVLVVAAEPGS